MKFLLFALFIALFISISIAAQVTTTNVAPLSLQTASFNLEKGDIVSGSLSVTGGNDDIDFVIKDPSGNEIVSKRRVQKGTTFSFTASSPGAYTVVFDNSFSLLTSKSVTLSYDAQRPSKGGGCFAPTAMLLTILGGIFVLKRD